MSTFWTNGGGILVNGSGQPILCASCPCSTIPCPSLPSGSPPSGMNADYFVGSTNNPTRDIIANPTCSPGATMVLGSDGGSYAAWDRKFEWNGTYWAATDGSLGSEERDWNGTTCWPIGDGIVSEMSIKHVYTGVYCYWLLDINAYNTTATPTHWQLFYVKLNGSTPAGDYSAVDHNCPGGYLPRTITVS